MRTVSEKMSDVPATKPDGKAGNSIPPERNGVSHKPRDRPDWKWHRPRPRSARNPNPIEEKRKAAKSPRCKVRESQRVSLTDEASHRPGAAS